MTSKTKPILFSILFTIFVDFLGYGLVIPVLASIFLDKHAAIISVAYSEKTRLELLGVVIAAYPLGQFFGAPFLGALSDKIGRKKVLLTSLIGTCLGYILFALGVVYKALPLLIISRALDGFTGGNVSTAYSAIADISDKDNKTRNFGLVGAALGLGFIIGPVIGGKLSDPAMHPNFNFATPFWFAAVISLINILSVYFLFSETLQHKNQNVKLSFLTGFKNLYHAFTIADLKYLFMVVFFSSFGFISFTQFFQVFLIEKFQYTQSQIGNIFAYIGIWMVITQGFVTRFVLKKYSASSIIKVSLLGLAISIPLLVLPDNHYMLFFVTPLIALSQGLSQPSITTLISNIAPKSEQGEILGINQSLQAITYMIPPIIAGILSTYSVKAPLIMASLCILVAWGIYLSVAQHKKALA